MKIRAMTPVLFVMVALALPFAAQADKNADCDMHGKDMSKMTAEQKQQMKEACGKKAHHDCSEKSADFAKMSAEDKQKALAHCHNEADDHKNSNSHKNADAKPGATPAVPAQPATPPDSQGQGKGKGAS